MKLTERRGACEPLIGRPAAVPLCHVDWSSEVIANSQITPCLITNERDTHFTKGFAGADPRPQFQPY